MGGPGGGSQAARIASAVVLAARESVMYAGMDRGDFAAYLSAELERDIPPEELEFWEIGGSMPGDVMLLCAVVIREVLATVHDFSVPADIRFLADRMSADLPRLPPGDPIRMALRRRPE